MATSQSDDVWNDKVENYAEQSWNKMQDEFTNVGYREGITKGKEDSLQEGFDDGFATVGAPLGRRLGIMRGIASGLLTVLKTNSPVHREPITLQENMGSLCERLEIVSQRLNALRLKDISPRDIQAEAHAREHRDIEKEGTDAALAEAFEELSTKDDTSPDKLQELSSELEDILGTLNIRIPIQI